MNNGTKINHSPAQFFFLVIALSIPFWALGWICKDITSNLPINLPISALMTFCPLIAGAILVYKQGKIQGVKKFLKLAFDFKNIKSKKWYIPVVLFMPLIAVLSYWHTKISGALLPEPKVTLPATFIFFFVFFIGAIGEELGWSGYVINPLQSRYGALKASINVGIIWAIWHIIPWSQAHHTTLWIVWHCMATIFLRVIMVWLFNNTGRSVFAMILFHAMINISPYLIPNNGSDYDPFIFVVLLMLTAIAITFLWGPKTLADYKFTITPNKLRA